MCQVLPEENVNTNFNSSNSININNLNNSSFISRANNPVPANSLYKRSNNFKLNLKASKFKKPTKSRNYGCCTLCIFKICCLRNKNVQRTSYLENYDFYKNHIENTLNIVSYFEFYNQLKLMKKTISEIPENSIRNTSPNKIILDKDKSKELFNNSNLMLNNSESVLVRSSIFKKEEINSNSNCSNNPEKLKRVMLNKNSTLAEEKFK